MRPCSLFPSQILATPPRARSLVIASAETNSNLACYNSTKYGLHVLLQRNTMSRSPGEVYAHSHTPAPART